jgi:cytochrome b561
MPLKNSTTRWGHVAQLLHWVIVALILVQVTYGLWAAQVPLVKRLSLIAQHKSFGITILGLAVLRLLWRFANPAPELPGTLKAWERVAAHVTHWGLYVLLFALPISGWLMSSARGFPVSWFGRVQLPDLVSRNPALYDAMLRTHHVLIWLLAAVLVLHIGAALKHHLVLKDDVLKRMLPFT